jgi:hypothetical protein
MRRMSLTPERRSQVLPAQRGGVPEAVADKAKKQQLV